jgi:hypothetical protein
VNVAARDRLKPFNSRVNDSDHSAPGPVSDPGQEGEHEVELLLNRKEIRAVTPPLPVPSHPPGPVFRWAATAELLTGPMLR